MSLPVDEGQRDFSLRSDTDTHRPVIYMGHTRFHVSWIGGWILYATRRFPG